MTKSSINRIIKRLNKKHMDAQENVFGSIVDSTMKLSQKEVVQLVDAIMAAHGLMIVPTVGVQVQQRPTAPSTDAKTFEEHVKNSAGATQGESAKS